MSTISMSNQWIKLFIVGLPKSGIKLLRELLNNHSQIFIPAFETYFIPHLVKKYGNKILDDLDVSNVIEEIKNTLFFFYYNQQHTFEFESHKSNNISVKELITDVFQKVSVAKLKEPVPVLCDKTSRNTNHMPYLLDFFTETKLYIP